MEGEGEGWAWLTGVEVVGTQEASGVEVVGMGWGACLDDAFREEEAVAFRAEMVGAVCRAAVGVGKWTEREGWSPAAQGWMW